MNNYTVQLGITARSASSTLRICYRQAVKDSWKIYNVLSSDEAIATYKYVWTSFVIICQIVFLCGKLTRTLWDLHVQPKIDAHVKSCLQKGDAPTQEEKASRVALTFAQWVEQVVLGLRGWSASDLLAQAKINLASNASKIHERAVAIFVVK